MGWGRKNYSFCFFFGPGFPLGLGAKSTWLALRLAPGFGPGNPFRRGVSVDAAPAGVEFASEALSDGGTGASAMDEAGESSFSLTGEEAFVVFIFESVGLVGVLFEESLGNRLKSSGDSLRTMTVLVLPVRLERPLDADAMTWV